MAAATVIARTSARRGWRPLLVLALFVAVAAGLAMAGVAGARRTWSVLDRVVAANESLDVMVNPDLGIFSELRFEDVAALPMVADASRLDVLFVVPDGGVGSQREFEELPLVVVGDGGAGWRFDRPAITAGRLPDPAAPDELLVDRHYAARAGVEVGDRFDWRVIREEDGALLGSTELTDAELAVATAAPDFGIPVSATVVGIGTTPDRLVVDEGFEPTEIYGTPALRESVPDGFSPFWVISVRLTEPTAVPAFEEAVSALVPDEAVIFQTMAASAPKVQRAIDPPAVTLLVFGLVAAGLGALLVGQAIARRLQVLAADDAVLSALGTTRGERFRAMAAQLLAVAVVGGLGGAVIAWLLSPTTPVGPARVLEPTAGLHVDALVLVAGVVVTIVVVMVMAVPLAWRRARLAPTARSSRRTVARMVAASGAPVPLATGVRFGLESGSGSSAVPARTTIVGATTGVVLVVAATVLAGSIDAVAETPRLYGADWTYAVDFLTEDEPPNEHAAAINEAVAADPDVDGTAVLAVTEVRLDGMRTPALAFVPGSTIAPTLAAGRAPRVAGEVALGSTTMERLGVGLGDQVELATREFDGPATVVGRAVLPGVGLYQAADKTALGEGAIVSRDVIGSLTDDADVVFAARLADGADEAAFTERIGAELAEYGQVYLQRVGRPADVGSLVEVRRLPLFLSGLLGVLIAATVVHSLWTAVRRRRRDLALLQVLGATRRTIRSVGVWQALTVAAVAVLVGLPLGVIVGRAAWTLLATEYGTAAEPVVRAGALVVTAMGLATLAALVGWLPAARAVRQSPAEILKTE